jgi:hypothetical protein
VSVLSTTDGQRIEVVRGASRDEHGARDGVEGEAT